MNNRTIINCKCIYKQIFTILRFKSWISVFSMYADGSRSENNSSYFWIFLEKKKSNIKKNFRNIEKD